MTIYVEKCLSLIHLGVLFYNRFVLVQIKNEISIDYCMSGIDFYFYYWKAAWTLWNGCQKVMRPYK